MSVCRVRAEKDLDERMHTTPWYYATELPNVPASNLVQIGIGGWQVPRESLPNMRERQHNVFTIGDIEELGIDRVVGMAVRPPNFPSPCPGAPLAVLVSDPWARQCLHSF